MFLAKNFRSNQILSGDVLWQQLRRNNILGQKFKRQYVFLGFIIDFYCPRLKLAIEVDGKVHDNQKEFDKVRQKIIEEHGVYFLRFSTYEVVFQLERVITRIQNFIIKNYKFINIPPSPELERGARGERKKINNLTKQQ